MAYNFNGISGTGPGDIWAVGSLNENANQAALDPFIEQAYHLICR